MPSKKKKRAFTTPDGKRRRLNAPEDPEPAMAVYREDPVNNNPLSMVSKNMEICEENPGNAMPMNAASFAGKPASAEFPSPDAGLNTTKGHTESSDPDRNDLAPFVGGSTRSQVSEDDKPAPSIRSEVDGTSKPGERTNSEHPPLSDAHRSPGMPTGCLVFDSTQIVRQSGGTMLSLETCEDEANNTEDSKPIENPPIENPTTFGIGSMVSWIYHGIQTLANDYGLTDSSTKTTLEDSVQNIRPTDARQPRKTPSFRVTDDCVPTQRIPEGTEIIRAGTFYGCQTLVAVELPSSLKEIENHAFYKCTQLRSIGFHEGLEVIGAAAFQECHKLSTIELPSSLKRLENDAFQKCKGLVSVRIQEGLEIIGVGAFRECCVLSTIDIPSSLKKIEGGAFCECTALRSVRIQEGLEAIGAGGFRECCTLPTIDLPSSLKTIEKEAFYKCTGLMSVTIQEGLVTIGQGAFQQCSNLKRIDLPSSLKTIKEQAFCECKQLKSIMIQEGIEIIRFGTFQECHRLLTIKLPSSLEIIEEQAFFNCNTLKSVIIQEGLVTIGQGAFQQCSNLKRIDLPSSLKTIKEQAFCECKQLKSIMIQEGIEIIRFGTFQECHRLLTIKLPSSLEIIEEQAFFNCNTLKSVIIQEGLKSIGISAFQQCPRLESINLPSSLKRIDEQAFFQCKQLKSIVIKEGLETIGKAAFSECPKLSSVDLPSSLKTIEKEAFSHCSGLKSIRIPEGIQMLGKRAFFNCEAMWRVALPSTLNEIGDSFISCKKVTCVQFTESCTLQKESIEKNTILHQLLLNDYPYAFIHAFLKSCPSAAREKNFLGQTPLHLCVSNQLSSNITKAIYHECPGALNTANEIGKTPLVYWKENGCRQMFASIFHLSPTERIRARQPIEAFLLKGGKWITYTNPVMLRGHHLIFEVPDCEDEMIVTEEFSFGAQIALRDMLRDQIFARNLLFGKLLTEFANLLKYENKEVIQRAAALQALCGEHYLSNCAQRCIDLNSFSGSALWYQHEILKLVLRVYNEDQTWDQENDAPAAFKDAKKGQTDLESLTKPFVTDYRRNTFLAFAKWIVDDLKDNQYDVEGPELKPLQSLFNKIYIRRGQTRVNVVGDMTRATLHIKEKRDLENVISRLKKTFPEITKPRSPDDMGVLGFLKEISIMKKLNLKNPETQLIPYRLKVNSSQNKKFPLLYNLNFFDLVPEYHRVGNTEMFVAFELQIGLAAEIRDLRKNHKAYEQKRILNSQTLLRDYIETTLPPSAIKNNDDYDFKIVSAILEGRFSKHDWLFLEDIERCGEGTTLRAPRLCLNNKRLNTLAKRGNAFVVDKISLDSSLQYCVKSLLLDLTGRIQGVYFGLFALVGPYMVNVSSRYIDDFFWDQDKFEKDGGHYIIKPNKNFETLERISQLPPGCDEVVLIAWGRPRYRPVQIENNQDYLERLGDPLTWSEVQQEYYRGMKLVLSPFRTDPEESGSILNEVFNLVKSIVGVGVLSLPAGVAAFGSAPSACIPAAILIAAIGTLSGYGFSLIGKVCAYTGAKTYREAWSKSVGEETDWVPAVSIALKCFLVCLAFSMVLADTFSSLLETERNSTLLVITVVILFPLCLIKNLKSMAPFSLLGSLGMACTAGAMTLRLVDGSYSIGRKNEGRFIDQISSGLRPRFGNLGAEGILSPNALILVCMLSTAFMSHHNAPKFYIELKNNTIPRFNRMVMCGFGISILLMCLITTVGFLTFGEASNGIILNNYAGTDVWMGFSRIAVSISLLFSYPLAFTGLREACLDLKMLDSSHMTTVVLLLCNITYFAMSLADVSFVLAFGGAILGNASIYVYPALMYRATVARQGRMDEQFGVYISLASAALSFVVGALGAIMAIRSLVVGLEVYLEECSLGE